MLMRLVHSSLVMLMLPALAFAQACPLAPQSVGGFQVRAMDRSAVLFRSGLNVNADGAPNAYHRVLGPTTRDPGLLHICNGASVLALQNGRLVNLYPSEAGTDWAACKRDYFQLQQAGFPSCETGRCVRTFGFVASGRPCGFNRQQDNCGIPVVRALEGEPGSQYLPSQTPLVDSSVADPADPRRYPDARYIPHFVLPGGEKGVFSQSYGMRYGDLALLTWQARATYAVFADAGPGDKLGEASYAAINRLRGAPDSDQPQKRPIENGVTTLLLPGSRHFMETALPPDGAAVQAAGRRAMQSLGGIERFRNCPGLALPLSFADH